MTDPPPSTERLAMANQALESPELSLSKEALSQTEDTLFINDNLPGLVFTECTALLLDINNLYRRSQNNEFRIDYAKLRQIFMDRCDLRLAAAFSAVDREDTKSEDWVKFMHHNGYRTQLKDLKRYVNRAGKSVSKGNMDIELTLAAMSLSPAFTHIIIGTCDGDFVPLVHELRKGFARKVSVLGVRNADWTGMSDSLVRAADNFYDLNVLVDHICKTDPTMEG